MIIWFAISTGVTAGLSYYKNQEKTENKPKNQHLNQNVNNFTQNTWYFSLNFLYVFSVTHLHKSFKRLHAYYPKGVAHHAD